MRVKCVAELPSAEQATILGKLYRSGSTTYPITVGEEYAALGVGWWSGTAWIEIAMEVDLLLSVPAFLFEIVDGRSSAHWEVRTDAQEGSLTAWPNLFYREYFRSDLADKDPAVLAEFRKVRDAMLREAHGEH